MNEKKKFLETVDALISCCHADGTAALIASARPKMNKDEQAGLDKGYDPQVTSHKSARRKGNDAYYKVAKQCGFVNLFLGSCAITVRYTPRSLATLRKNAARLPVGHFKR